MHLKLAVLAAALVGVNAASNSTTDLPTDGLSCTTAQGSSSVALVPSTTNFVTIQQTATVNQTVTPSLTITPAPATSTSVIFTTETETTTLSQETDTFTDTTTVFVTTTSTGTETVTTTVTETTTTTGEATTSTVGTAPGFVPLASTLPQGSTFAKRGKRACKAKPKPYPVQSQAQSSSSGVSLTSQLIPTASASPDPLFPQSVFCTSQETVVSTITLTDTASETVTSTAEQVTETATSTSTISVTSTSTLRPASATETTTTTATISTTTIEVTTATETATATATYIPPGPTVYGACQANNMLSSVNGNAILGYVRNGAYSITQTASAADCCTACQAAGPSCGAFAFLFQANVNSCYMFAQSANTCDPSVSVATFILSGGTNNRLTAGNSGCGRQTYQPPV